MSTAPEPTRAPGPLILQVLAAWLLVTAVRFVPDRLAYTEADALPSARQWFEHGWLPGDWYLNLDISYRVPFNLLMGPLVAVDVPLAVTAGRLLAYVVMAAAMVTLWRVLGVRFSLGMLALWAALAYPTIAAGEYAVGGADAKGLAWPLALLALGLVLSGRIHWGSAALGAALSFHVLVGLQAAACLAVGILLARNATGLRWTDLRRAWPFLLTGCWGLVEVARQMRRLGGGDEDAGAGWLAYVEFRVPHHVDPGAWQSTSWPLVLTGCAVIAGLALWRSRVPQVRLLAAVSLAAAGLFCFGLLVAWLAPLEWSRFYWFRFGDAFLPVSTGLLLAQGVGRLLPADRRWVPVASAVVATVLVGSAAVQVIRHAAIAREPGSMDPSTPIMAWIREHTEPEARFLVDPRLDGFYLGAERAVYVTYRHAPQSGSDLAEWHRRLESVAGHEVGRGTMVSQIAAGYQALGADQLRHLADAEDLDYYLVRNREDLDTLPLVHEEDGWQLYRLP